MYGFYILCHNFILLFFRGLKKCEIILIFFSHLEADFLQGFVSGSGTRIPRGWIRIRIRTPLKLFSTLFSYGSTRFGRVILFAFCFSTLKSKATLCIGLSATTFKNFCSSTPCVHTNSCLKCNLPKEFSCPSVCHSFLKEGGGSYSFGALVTI